MDVTQVTSLVSQVGFPIFVAGFMLLKQNKDTENMTTVLTGLKTAIESISAKIDNQNGGPK